MIHKPFDWISFESLPIVGILRNISREKLDGLLPHYIDAGFSTIEITMNTDGAEQMIANTIKHHGNRLNVGAGTVCSLEDLEKAVNAGANFIVTPVIVRSVIKKCVEMNIPVFPGAYTPTEIFDAWSMGASMVKVFPASILGPDFIKSMKAPFPHIKMMPTGGINLKDISDYKKNGAEALGIGSPLFPSDLIENKSWNQFSDHLKSFKYGWESC